MRNGSRVFQIAWYLMVQAILFGCQPLPRDEMQEDAVARVHEKFLYSSDLLEIVPVDASAEDSARIASAFINNWIREQLLLEKAEQNLADEQKHFDKLIDNYRKSLITHAYETEVINQLLDTVISNQEIEAYYNENQKEFELKDNIIKVRYIKAPRNSPDLNKVKRWYLSDNPEDIQALESYCYQFAENFYLDDNTWLLFDDLLKEIPLDTYNKEEFLKNNRHIELEDSSSVYLVNIKGFRIKNSTSPLSFEKDNIRNILLNKRKLELVARMKNDIYDEGLRKKHFEIYE